MNTTNGKSELQTVSDAGNSAFYAFLCIVMSISIFTSLLLVVPLTIQYISTILSARAEVTPLEDRATHKNEINLFRYRILFNCSVLFTVMFSSFPLLIYLTHNTSGYVSSSNNKDEVSAYVRLLDSWGMVQFINHMDMFSRLFFSWMVTAPSLLVCAAICMGHPPPVSLFRTVLIFSGFAFLCSILAPACFIAGIYRRVARYNESTAQYGALLEQSSLYRNYRLLELVGNHALPVLLLLPAILAASRHCRSGLRDQIFYEPIVYVITNVPVTVLDIIEQCHFSTFDLMLNDTAFALFYMMSLVLYHVGYTIMFVILPLRMITGPNDEDQLQSHLQRMYGFVIQRKAVRRNLRRQFSRINS